MEYYINPMWFYWLHVIESLRGVCIGLLIISFFVIVATGVAICDESDDDIEKEGKRIIKFCCFFSHFNELLKPLSATSRSQAEAKVPSLARRTSCTLATLRAFAALVA